MTTTSLGVYYSTATSAQHTKQDSSTLFSVFSISLLVCLPTAARAAYTTPKQQTHPKQLQLLLFVVWILILSTSHSLSWNKQEFDIICSFLSYTFFHCFTIYIPIPLLMMTAKHGLLGSFNNFVLCLFSKSHEDVNERRVRIFHARIRHVCVWKHFAINKLSAELSCRVDVAHHHILQRRLFFVCQVPTLSLVLLIFHFAYATSIHRWQAAEQWLTTLMIFFCFFHPLGRICEVCYRHSLSVSIPPSLIFLSFNPINTFHI